MSRAATTSCGRVRVTYPATPPPERGFALAALTGALSFQHAKPSMLRALIAERVDPVLFELSYDYVGDLSETVALMWKTRIQPEGAPRPTDARPFAFAADMRGRDSAKARQ